MESKCLSAFRGAIVHPLFFHEARRRLRLVKGRQSEQIWAETDRYLGNMGEELFHDARRPHSQDRWTPSSCQDLGIDGSAGVKPGVL
jgi:hypothetical protein